MKHLLVFSFLFPLLTAAQGDCKLIRDVDPFTKLKTISTGFIPLDGASLTIDASKPEVDMLFSIKGANKCFTNNSTAAIYFVGTKVKQTQRNEGTMNCEGLFHFIFRNTALPQVLLRKLSTQLVDKIVFTGNDKAETVLVFTGEQQQQLKALAACIAQEAPTLLQ
jgi:hypothetical protein